MKTTGLLNGYTRSKKCSDYSFTDAIKIKTFETIGTNEKLVNEL